MIEAVPRKRDAAYPLQRQRYWLRKDTGIAAKMVGYGKEDKPVVTSTTADVKLNADIRLERFKFEAPPDVVVMDMTKAGQPSTLPAATDDEPKTEKPAAKADEKKPDSEKKPEGKGVKSLLNKVLR